MSRFSLKDLIPGIRAKPVMSRISLKDFIQGVKKELISASEAGAANPILELTQLELEAEFSVAASANADGGFELFLKVGGEATASETRRVKMIFTPLKQQPVINFENKATITGGFEGGWPSGKPPLGPASSSSGGFGGVYMIVKPPLGSESWTDNPKASTGVPPDAIK